MTEQLTFDLEAACARLLADRLADRRRVPAGAERLLAELARRGLSDRALTRAAGLCLLLDANDFQQAPPNHQEEA